MGFKTVVVGSFIILLSTVLTDKNAMWNSISIFLFNKIVTIPTTTCLEFGAWSSQNVQVQRRRQALFPALKSQKTTRRDYFISVSSENEEEVMYEGAAF